MTGAESMRVAILGAGRLGRALAAGLIARQRPAALIWNRSASPIATHSGALPAAELGAIDLALICVVRSVQSRVPHTISTTATGSMSAGRWST